MNSLTLKSLSILQRKTKAPRDRTIFLRVSDGFHFLYHLKCFMLSSNSINMSIDNFQISIHFREWKEKYNLVDNDENDTLTYNFKQTYIFRPDLSAPGLTGDEIIVMPHPCNYTKKIRYH